MAYYDNTQRKEGAAMWNKHILELQKALQKKDKKRIQELLDKAKEMDFELMPGSDLDKKSAAYRYNRFVTKANSLLEYMAYIGE